MTQVLLPFLTAAQIFPGSFWPIILMGSILEVAKLVTVSWLYNNWNVTVRIMRYYFSIAIVLLMLITSMGIFGYLSKAHLESNVTLGANSVQLKTLETQEKIAKDKLTYLLQRAGDPATASNKIDRQIQETQAELKRISNEKLPLLAEENKLAAEIGPIKAQQTLRNTKLPEPEIKIRKAKKKKTLDTSSGPSLESFFVDEGEGMEHIPKNKITKMDGGTF